MRKRINVGGKGKNGGKKKDDSGNCVRAQIVFIASKQSHSTMTLLKSSHVVRSVAAHHGHVTSANCMR
jgi:hypothetical protein